MALETKSGSKNDLNESSIPLLEVGGEKVENVESNVTEEKKETDKKEKKKKEKKPKSDKPRRTFNECTQNFTIGLNVLDRDEKRINDHVNLHFEDVIGEPDSTQGFEFFWRLTFLIFNSTRFWLYRFLSAIIAIPLALLWAVVFALVNVGTIWCATPGLRIFDIVLFYVHRVWSGLVRTVLDPFFTSAGLLLSNIRSKREQVTAISA